MSVNNSEEAVCRHDRILKVVKDLLEAEVAVCVEPDPKIPDLQTHFQNVMSDAKTEPSEISKYTKYLQKAEEQRKAASRSKTLEKMHQDLLYSLHQAIGHELCQKWSKEWPANSRLPGDTTPSDNHHRFSSEYTDDYLEYIRETTGVSIGGKALKQSSRHEAVCDVPITTERHPQWMQVIKSMLVQVTNGINRLIGM